jgi:hypothetical protein
MRRGLPEGQKQEGAPKHRPPAPHAQHSHEKEDLKIGTAARRPRARSEKAPVALHDWAERPQHGQRGRVIATLQAKQRWASGDGWWRCRSC